MDGWIYVCVHFSDRWTDESDTKTTTKGGNDFFSSWDNDNNGEDRFVEGLCFYTKLHLFAVVAMVDQLAVVE
jgi:hypothetical protein